VEVLVVADTERFEYEYAGFQFIIYRVGKAWEIIPASGQHWAAAKDRHLRNALEMFLQDRGEDHVIP
jgi:hypothetical protein